MRFSLRTLFFLVVLGFGQSLSAQLSWNTTNTSAARLPTCYETAPFEVELLNVSGSAMTGNRLRVELPPGMSYMPGSLVNLGCPAGAREDDLSNPNQPVFEVDNLPAIGNNPACFRFRASGNCQTLAFVLGGGILQNRYIFTHSGGTEPTHTTSAYTLDYPVLDFISVSNAAYVGNLGDTYTQTVRVSNGGNSPAPNFFLALNPPAGLRFTAPNLGTLNATGDTIFFSGSDLGADLLFTPGEIIEFNYQVEVISCNNTNTNLALSWQCAGQSCGAAAVNPIAALVVETTPNLQIIRGFTNTTCFDNPVQQSLTIINTGNGLARDIIAEILAHRTADATPTVVPTYSFHIDTASLEWRMGNSGSFGRIFASNIQNGAGSFTRCPVGQRIGRAWVDLPELAPGDTLVIRWNMVMCCPSTTCGASDYRGNLWTYRVNYRNECQTANYTTNYQSGNSTSGSYGYGFGGITNGASGPVFLPDGATGQFLYSFTPRMTFSNFIEYRIFIPPGLDYIPGSAQIFNNLFNQACPWLPSSVTFSGDTLIARFPNASRPGCFGTTTRMEFSFEARANCAAPGYVPSAALLPTGQIWTQSFATCPSCVHLISCVSYSPLNLPCNVSCPAGGLISTDFFTQRQNFGLPDNNNNGIHDGAADGSLNFAAIRNSTLIQGDTLLTVMRGIVSTSAANPQFEFAYLQTVFTNMGGLNNTMVAIEAEVEIQDANTGNVYNCVLPIARPSNNTYVVDLSACFPVGFSLGDGDSVIVRSRYRYNGNSGGAVRVHNLENTFYASRVANPPLASRFACNPINGLVETIGWYYTICCTNVIQAANCAPMRLTKAYYLSIGPCCESYNGGNYFRNELRHFSFLDTMEIQLPPGYVLNSAYSPRVNYTRSFGATTPWTNIAPIDPNATRLKFPIGDLFTPRGGSFILSDEGYSGSFNFEILPSCGSASTDLLRYWGDFGFVDVPAFGTQGWGAAVDRVEYTGADLALSTSASIATPSDTLSWVIRLENLANNSSANNSFLAFRSRRGGLPVVEVRDLITNTVIAPINGIYQLGTRPSSSIREYAIRALSDCSQDTLVVYTGWNCLGYPLNLSDYPCSLDSLLLLLNDPAAELQFFVRSFADSANMCSPVLYELEFNSVRSASLTQLLAQANFPIGLAIMPGTLQYEYPFGSGFVAGPNPTFDPATRRYTFDVSSYNPTLASLPGLSEAPTAEHRRVRVRFRAITDCDFISGLSFNFLGQAGSPCGTPLSPINVQTPPLYIRGADPAPYFMQVSSQSDVVTACGADHPFYYRVSMINLGPQVTRAQDQLIIRLPAGIRFQGYDPADPTQRFAPGVQPTQTSLPGGITELRWNTRPGVPVGDSIIWRIRVEADNGPATCLGPNIIQTLSVVNSSVLCVADGTICPSQASNGDVTHNLIVQRPALAAAVIGTASNNYYDPNTGQNYLSLGTRIYNTGSPVLATDDLMVEYICDNDNSGTFTPGDTYIGNFTWTGGVPANDSVFFFFQDTFPVGLCDLNQGARIVAMLRDTTATGTVQCACEYSQRPMPDIILPLGLLRFELSQQACTHQLSWLWAAGFSPSEIRLEQSRDGQRFEPLQTPSPQETSWEGLKASDGQYYYRLTWRDAQGQWLSSPIRTARADCQGGTKPQLTVFPVPGQDQVSLRCEQDGREVKIRVQDALGRLVYQADLAEYRAGQNLELDIRHWAEGLYILQWQSGGQTWQQTIIKKQ